MQFKNSSQYFKQLDELIQKTKVNDETGLGSSLDEGIQSAIGLILKVLQEKRKVMVIGNGGSAAIASHVHNDLSKSVGMRALTFFETPLLTALSNDLDYKLAFETQVNLWAEKRDLMIAISSSGKSENIIRAVNAARSNVCDIITLSGFNEDNPLRKMGNINFYVPSGYYGFVETSHAALLHCLTDLATQEKEMLK
jgi:D-sedoheptulose 7-phosphate isomerase